MLSRVGPLGSMRQPAQQFPSEIVQPVLRLLSHEQSLGLSASDGVCLLYVGVCVSWLGQAVLVGPHSVRAVRLGRCVQGCLLTYPLCATGAPSCNKSQSVPHSTVDLHCERL